MASFSNKIVTTIEVLTDKSAASLKSFRQSIQEADGASGKLKAGFGQAGDFIKSHAAGVAASAGAALIGFAAKAVSEFQNLALESGKMADTLGISTESASRWIEVAGDIGASTEDVTKSMARLEREVAKNPAQFDALGVSIAYAANGSVDANETFIRTLEALKRIKDPTERQEAANKLLGRSWGNLAEIVNGDVREALASVSDAKVISDRQVADARRLRDAFDNLKGAAEDVTLEVGTRLTPTIADAAETLADWKDPIADAIVGLVEIGKVAVDVVNPIDNLTGGFSRMTKEGASGAERAAGAFEMFAGGLPIVGEGVSRVTEALFDNDDVSGKLAETSSGLTEVTEDLTAAAEEQAQVQEDVAATLDAVKKAAKDAATEIQNYLDTVNSAISADFGYQDSLNGVEDAVVALFGKVQELNKAQGDDRAQALEEVQRAEQDLLQAYLDQSLAAAALWQENARLAGAQWTATDSARAQRDELLKLQATTEPGSALFNALQGYIDKLNSVPGVLETDVQLNTEEAARRLEELRQAAGALQASLGVARSSYSDPAAAARAAAAAFAPTSGSKGGALVGIGATGGIVTQPTMALIGEAGPEAVVPLNQMPGASPLPGGMSRGGDTINIYANVIEKDTARWIVEQIAKARQTMGASTVQRAVNG